jgi:hypothetical protein
MSIDTEKEELPYAQELPDLQGLSVRAFPSRRESVPKMRKWIRRKAGKKGSSPDIAEAVISELGTNGVEHGTIEEGQYVFIGIGHVKKTAKERGNTAVFALDSTPSYGPQSKNPDPVNDEHGRGSLIVDAFTVRRGNTTQIPMAVTRKIHMNNLGAVLTFHPRAPIPQAGKIGWGELPRVSKSAPTQKTA